MSMIFFCAANIKVQMFKSLLGRGKVQTKGYTCCIIFKIHAYLLIINLNIKEPPSINWFVLIITHIFFDLTCKPWRDCSGHISMFTEHMFVVFLIVSFTVWCQSEMLISPGITTASLWRTSSCYRKLTTFPSEAGRKICKVISLMTAVDYLIRNSVRRYVFVNYS